MILILEGLISVGKTTLGKSLEQRGHFIDKPVIFLPEYTNPEFLDLFLSNQQKYAFTYQSVMLKERLNTHRKAEYLSKQGYCVIIDRGIAGDLSFALIHKQLKNINPDEWKAYWSIVCEHKTTEWKPDLVIHLKCSPELAFYRLKKRGNSNEVNAYNLKYFKQLGSNHEKAFELYDQVLGFNTPLLKIDWSKSEENNSDGFLPEDYLFKFERDIKEFLSDKNVIK